MTFVKVVKTRPYFKRYQVKFRRRREGKTDYKARRRLVAQAKTKYNSPKYRFVVRVTNKDIVCQIVSSKIVGDVIECCAYSHELKRYGIPLGLTNYAAAYATGLLLARRILKQRKLDQKYPGKNSNGQFFLVEKLKEGPKPFKAFLDVGLARTTTGSKVFAALKGACDGGLFIPHGEECSKFAGYVKGEFNPEMLKDYILGGHVCDYMEKLKKSDPVKYGKQFKRFIDAKISGNDLEKLYLEAHKKIRENPDRVQATPKPEGFKHFVHPKRQVKLTVAQRKERSTAKKTKLLQELEKIRAEKNDKAEKK